MNGRDDRRGRVALVTGASRGLGQALATRLVRDGWRIVVDARDGQRLAAAVAAIEAPARVTAIRGDVAAAPHRAALADAAAAAGGLDLLVNNASVLGPSPRPSLDAHPVDVLERVLAVNAVAPLALMQLTLPLLARRGGRVINVSSDAAVGPYPGWGGYGASKAALDHLTAVFAAENPALRCFAVDPGDMATDLHQQAFPGEDISDRPSPGEIVPAFVRLIDDDLPSGRYRASDLVAGAHP